MQNSNFHNKQLSLLSGYPVTESYGNLFQCGHLMLEILHLFIPSTGSSNKNLMHSSCTWDFGIEMSEFNMKRDSDALGWSAMVGRNVLWPSQSRTGSQRRLPREGKACSGSWNVNRRKPGKDGMGKGLGREQRQRAFLGEEATQSSARTWGKHALRG